MAFAFGQRDYLGQCHEQRVHRSRTARPERSGPLHVLARPERADLRLNGSPRRAHVQQRLRENLPQFLESIILRVMFPPTFVRAP